MPSVQIIPYYSINLINYESKLFPFVKCAYIFGGGVYMRDRDSADRKRKIRFIFSLFAVLPQCFGRCVLRSSSGDFRSE